MKKVSFIDSLHIVNHKQELCHQIYNPELLKSELPDANTMIAEQTFTWLSRYKVLFLFILLSHFERIITLWNPWNLQTPPLISYFISLILYDFLFQFRRFFFHLMLKFLNFFLNEIKLCITTFTWSQKGFFRSSREHSLSWFPR